MNLRAALLASMALAFVAVGTGCSNKADAERQSLLSQNDDLKKQLDAERTARSQADARANAVTAQTPSTPDTVATPPMDGGPLDLSTGPTGKGPKSGGTVDLGGYTSSTNNRGEAVLEISGDVLFDSGKAALKASSKKALDSVATTLKTKYAGQQIRVEGHTDPAPVKTSGWDDNWDLSSARANSVRKYLETKGVKNMYIAGFAATEPKNTKNQALNRRVDIVVVKNAK